MVKLTTTYNNQFNSKMFMLKGEESYAKSTDITMNIKEFTDSYNHLSKMRIGLELSVHRMIGDNSKIVIYDGEEPIYSVDWSESVNKTLYNNSNIASWDEEKQILTLGLDNNWDTGLLLDYDVEHVLYARFMGNKQCMKSESQHTVWNIPTPPKYESSMTLSSPSTVYSDTLINDISLIWTSSENIEENKTISLYDNDKFLKTIEVEKNNPIPLDLNLSYGLHTIKAIFDGDEEATACKTEYTISVGYKIRITDYTRVLVDGDTTGFITGIIYDYSNNTVPNLLCYFYTNDTRTQLATTETDGTFTMNNVPFTSNPWRVIAGHNGSSEYTTKIARPKAYLKTSKSWVSEGFPATLSGYVHEYNKAENIEIENIPVKLKVETGYGGDTSTYTMTAKTKSDGTFTKEFNGNGEYSKYSIQALVYNYNGNMVYLDEYLAYWQSSEKIRYSKEQVLTKCTITDKVNGFLIQSNMNNHYGELEIPLPDFYSNWEITFTIKSFVDTSQSSIMFNGTRINSNYTVKPKSGSKVKLIYDSTTGMWHHYIDNKVVHTTDSWATLSYQGLYITVNNTGGNTDSSYIIIDDLKIIRG